MSKALELSQLANNLTITEGTDTVTLGQANVVLSGNLQVDGTSTTLNTSTLTVDDLNITIADGAASAAAADGAGLTVDGASATLIYGSTNDNWSFNKRLDVTGDVVINSSGVHASGCLQINNSSTTNSFPKAIEAYNSGIGVGHRHQIMLGKDGSNYDTSTISFYYAGSASTSNRLEFGFWNAGSLLNVQADGNVGIGTASPAKKLHIRDSIPDIRLEDTDTNAVVDLKGNTGTGSFVISTDVNNAIADSKIIFEVDNDEKVRINANGDVGIGTNDPSNRLEVAESFGNWRINDYGGMMFHNTSDANNERFIHGRSSGVLSIGYVPIANLTGGVGGYGTQAYDQMTILTNGNVGIGTTTIGSRLHVHGTGSDGQEVLEVTSAGNVASAGYHWMTTATAGSQTNTNSTMIMYVGQALSNKNGGYLGFNYQGASSDASFLTLGGYQSDKLLNVRMDGKVGIGTTNPSQILEAQTAGTTYITASTTGTGTSAGHRATAGTNDWVWFATQGQSNLRLYDYSSSVVRLTIENTGHVGIGTEDPDRALHIEGSDFASSTIRLKRTGGGTNNDAGLQFQSAAGANADTGMGGIWFQNSLDGNAYALIRARTDDATGTSGRLDFMTSTSLVDNNTSPSMTIASSGNVGIGTNSPGSLLTVGSGATARGSFSDILIAPNGDNAQIEFWGANTSFAISHFDNDRLGIYSNVSSSWDESRGINIQGDGDVGIGTTNPTRRLHVQQSAGDDVATFINADTTNGYGINVKGGGSASGRYVLRLADGSDNVRMLVLANGNVGIGTTDPTGKLEVYDAAPAANTSVVIHNNSASHAAMFKARGERASANQDVSQFLTDNSGKTIANIRGVTDADTTSGRLEFWTAPSASNAVARMTVDSAGQVGIGTTTPGNNLTIDIAASNTGITLSDHGDGFFPQIIYDSNRTSAGQGLGKFTSNWNGTEVARIEFAAGADTTNKDDGEMLFYTKQSGVALAERMRIDDVGFIGIGTNSPSTKVHIYDSGAPRLRIQSTSTALADTPGIDLIKRGNTTNGVDLGVINWYGNDALGNDQRYAYLFADAEDTASGSEDGRFFMTVARGGGTGTVYYEMRGIGGSDNPLNAHHEFRGTADGHIMHVRRDVIDRGNSGAVMAISLGENTGPEDDPWIDFYNYGTTGAGGENQVNGSIGTVNGNQGTHIWGYETLMLRATTDTDMPALSSTSGTGLTINSTSSTFYGTFNAQGISNFNNTTASTSPTTGSVIIDGGLGVAGDIHAGADVTAFSASDQRLKTNLQPIENSLNKVKSLTGYTFNWNELAENKPQDQREAGILAQDVEAVLPEVTTTRDDGYKAVRYEKMVPMLIEAIKELSDKVDAQQQEIERLRKWQ